MLWKFGNNEKFFQNINEECIELEQGKALSQEIRKKYDMLRIILTDDRRRNMIEHSQYNFADIGDPNIKTIDFCKYGRKLCSIPIDEIERMWESLNNNPGYEIPIDFYTRGIGEINCSIKNVKEVAEKSKQPLSFIKRAFEIIEDIRLGKKREKEQKRSER